MGGSATCAADLGSVDEQWDGGGDSDCHLRVIHSPISLIVNLVLELMTSSLVVCYAETNDG